MNQPRIDREPGRRRWRLLLVAPAAIGLALAAAACGAGSPQAGVASVGTITTTVQAGGAASGGPASTRDPLRYAACMRSHGIVNFPDPGSPSSVIRAFKSSGAFSSATLEAAGRACAKYNGGVMPGTSSPQVSPKEMQKLLAVSRCMRAHGVPTFPDPNPNTGDMSPPAGISRNSPTVLAALRACSQKAQAAGLGPPSTGQ